MSRKFIERVEHKYAEICLSDSMFEGSVIGNARIEMFDQFIDGDISASFSRCADPLGLVRIKIFAEWFRNGEFVGMSPVEVKISRIGCGGFPRDFRCATRSGNDMWHDADGSSRMHWPEIMTASDNAHPVFNKRKSARDKSG